MTLSKLYVGSSAAFAAATFLLIAMVNPTLPPVRRCLNQQAEHGGIAAAINGMPSVLAHSAIKGFLWPLSLVNAVAIHDMRFGTWLLNRYDPFNGSCR